ncbi:MAG: hypothetical protein ACXIUD_09735 [Mongoliitalea sp.]
MKFIYEAILARIADQLPEIKYVDLDKGQFNYERPPVAWPACLISMQVTSTQENHRSNLHKQLLVTFRLGWDFSGNTSSITPEPDREESLAYFDLVDKLEAAFQGWDDGSRRFNYFSQQQLREEPRMGPKVVAIPFRTSYHDQK